MSKHIRATKLLEAANNGDINLLREMKKIKGNDIKLVVGKRKPKKKK